ncbi:MAG: cytochrome ubiquinol oxidase subunit I [Myxococcota bacterium]|jgi:cytochrome d ubiquinol oxidase subunit I|nr:cytochrome ubiquinol oxidase subunit I [Myxococcota bacterium]
MELDVLLLSRLQFAFTIMFHYIFPPLSIGLGVLLVMMEGMYLKTRDPQYEAMARFWTRVFAVNFAMGVASGIVMEFEFGTNWAAYSRYVGDVFGSALAAEGLFAFFLESGFLAILVFGWDRVGPKMHFFSTLMVSLGSIFSSVWIIIANSWQQTPAGYHIVNGPNGPRAEILDFWAMVFNPSTVDRLSHTLLGAFILGAFFVMSISAYYVIKERHLDFAKRSFKIALALGTASSLLIAISGHSNANMVAENQPAKLAAFEGHFHTGEGASPLYIIGWPDEEAQEVKYGVAIPGMLSFLIHGDFETPVPGLDTIPDEDEPPVFLPFMTYHVMVSLGVFFIALTLLSCFFLWRGTLFEKRWLLWAHVFAVVGPYIANQAGWVSAEVGRQPFIVYGHLRTSDGLSEAVVAEHVLVSIIMFGLIYAMLFVVWVWVLNHKIQHGPEPAVAHAGGAPISGGKDLLIATANLSQPGKGHSLSGIRDEEEDNAQTEEEE